jgi:preprotein translocase subunit SecD
MGGAAVMLFMLAYYLLAGVVANVALIMNMLLLPVGLMV